MTAEEVKRTYPKVQVEHAPYFCMDLTYAYSVLVNGFRIPETTGMTMVKQIKYKVGRFAMNFIRSHRAFRFRFHDCFLCTGRELGSPVASWCCHQQPVLSESGDHLAGATRHHPQDSCSPIANWQLRC